MEDEEIEIGAGVDVGNDPRYPWVHVTLAGYQSPRFSIDIGGQSYGYSFSNGEMRPICLCHAYTPSECCCNTGNWDDYNYDCDD